MTSAAAPSPDREPSGPSLLHLAATILGRWRFIAALGFAGALIAAAWALLATPRYRSVAKFALEERTGIPGGSGLAALAGQLGGASALGVRSLQFYSDVVTGPDLLSALALDSFPDPAQGAARRPLIDLLDTPGDTPAERLNNVVDELQNDRIAATTNDRTGTITLSVSMPDAELSAAVARRLFQRLDAFNVETRKSAARERREFATRELERARRDLVNAEAELRGFLERNRGGLNVPRLAFEREQLERRIAIRADVYGELARELEQAKVDEVRDTPVFTLVEEPRAPVYREFPKRVRMTLTGAILGGALAVLLLVARSTTRSARALDPEGYDAVRAAFRRARA
ncbi:MAG TPA: hypothetical protein VFZ13_03495 [Gemmatimonadales bacterium]